MESDEIDIDHLIFLVEERPVIWHKSLDDYKSRKLTRSVWREVCCEVNHHFESLSDKETMNVVSLHILLYPYLLREVQLYKCHSLLLQNSGIENKITHICKAIYHTTVRSSTV